MPLGGTTKGMKTRGTEVAETWVDQAACPPRPHPLAPSPAELERGNTEKKGYRRIVESFQQDWL
jgi:hypothetical protein